MLQKCSPHTQTISVVLTETTIEQHHANVYRLIVPLTFMTVLRASTESNCPRNYCNVYKVLSVLRCLYLLSACTVSFLLILPCCGCFWATILMKMQLTGARSQVPIQDIATEMSDTSTKKRYRGKAFYKMKVNQVNNNHSLCKND